MPNLFQDIPDALASEFFETLMEGGRVRIERIVSRGHTSPGGGWYDQPQREFVVLLSGAGRLEFDGGETLELAPGDWLDIAPHRRHRVAWTDPEQNTVWLAIHCD